MRNLLKKINTKIKSPDHGASFPCWGDPFPKLRQKWNELPIANERIKVADFLKLKDQELTKVWGKMRENSATGENFSLRGWYHLLYKPLMTGKAIIDFGSGLGFDGLTFASYARKVTFVDIVSENIELLKRLARLKGIKNADFIFLESMNTLKTVNYDYDVFFANGSLHHAPMQVIRKEIQELAPRVKIGGRWLQLAYPKARWEREGMLPFSEWGEKTDGKGTPWAEWYDVDKLLNLFIPLKFKKVLSFEYHNQDFIWFDLLRKV